MPSFKSMHYNFLQITIIYKNSYSYYIDKKPSKIGPYFLWFVLSGSFGTVHAFLKTNKYAVFGMVCHAGSI